MKLARTYVRPSITFKGPLGKYIRVPILDRFAAFHGWDNYSMEFRYVAVLALEISINAHLVPIGLSFSEVITNADNP